MFLRKRIDDVKAVGHLHLLLYFGADFGFLYLNIVPCSNPFQCLHIAILFMLHHKADGIATFATAETLINLLARRYAERRRFFIVKRAVTNVIGTSFFQFHKFANNLNDVYAVGNLLYGGLGNQIFWWYRVNWVAALLKITGAMILFQIRFPFKVRNNAFLSFFKDSYEELFCKFSFDAIILIWVILPQNKFNLCFPEYSIGTVT